jgi:glutamate synthase domain-containing protein 1
MAFIRNKGTANTYLPLLKLRTIQHVSMVTEINWSSSFVFQIVRDAERLAMRMNHRGACACDNDTGDGAGVLTAIPHTFYAQELR